MGSGSTFGPQVTLSDTPAKAPAQAPPAAPDAPLATSAPPAFVPTKRRGDVPQHSILNFLSGENVTEVQKASMKAAEDRLRYGPGSSSPMLCKGLECPFLGYCDLHKSGIMLPLDEQCPIEQYMIAQWRDNFLGSLDYDIPGEHSAAVKMLVEDMAVEMVLQSRITKEAGSDPRVERPATIGLNMKGEPIEVTKLNPGLDLLLRINSSKLKILKDLLGSPRAKAEAGRLQSNDAGSAAAAAHKAANKMVPQATGPKRLEVPIFLPKETT